MTTTLFLNGRSQAVRIPKELRLKGREVSIRRLGDGVLIEPLTAGEWPEGFFETIHSRPTGEEKEWAGGGFEALPLGRV